MEFSPELFAEAVMSEYTEHIDGGGYSEEYLEALQTAILDDVLDNSYDGEGRAIDAAMEFSWYEDSADRFNWEKSPDFTMQDFYEHTTREYTFHYVWCLYAIVWGIRRYDAHKDAQT